MDDSLFWVAQEIAVFQAWCMVPKAAVPKTMVPKTIQTSRVQSFFRIVLGAFMLFAGVGHLTFRRLEFQAQVPPWLPLDPDWVVVLSGVAELALGAAMVFAGGFRVWVGTALAVFYVLIFPGNVSQYVQGIDAFGLDTDRARLIRLFFQPVLVLWALWSTGASTAWLSAWRDRDSA